ncbi:MAG: glucan biosynthesis protein, partial [Halomonas sp.]
MSVRTAAKWMLSLNCLIAFSAPANDDDVFDYVIERAKTLADAPYQPPHETLPSALTSLNYDLYRQIRFNPERAYWRDESPFSMQLFHSGFIFQTPVTINVINDGDVEPLSFSADDFQYDGDANRLLEHDLTGSGHAGFRLHYPINSDDYADEFAVFLGASYFRLVGRDQAYGLSTRGLAIDTALASGEEFPEFREFWLYKPDEDSDSVTLLALMDSPSLSGAYRITLTPGESTEAAVEATLFARSDIAKLGVAPL